MQHRPMAKKQSADLPLPEELLDRSIGLLEGPLNRVLERVLKSRVVLWPAGVAQAVMWKSAGFVVDQLKLNPRNRHNRTGG